MAQAVFKTETHRMIVDLDIYSTANLLIRLHGAGAELWAARRADLMLERGDRPGQAVWMQIKRAIVELQSPPSGPVS
jgi:hypothetical protein